MCLEKKGSGFDEKNIVSTVEVVWEAVAQET